MTAVLTLALGIGVTTAMFSVIDTMYWKAFPGASDPGRLVELETVGPDGSRVRGSWLDSRDYRDRLRLAGGVAAHGESAFNVGLERPKPVWGEMVGQFLRGAGRARRAWPRVQCRESSDAPGAPARSRWSATACGSAISKPAPAVGPNHSRQSPRVDYRRGDAAGVSWRDGRPAVRLWVPFTMGAELGALQQGISFAILRFANVYMFARLAPGVSGSAPPGLNWPPSPTPGRRGSPRLIAASPPPSNRCGARNCTGGPHFFSRCWSSWPCRF